MEDAVDMDQDHPTAEFAEEEQYYHTDCVVYVENHQVFITEDVVYSELKQTTKMQ